MVKSFLTAVCDMVAVLWKAARCCAFVDVVVRCCSQMFRALRALLRSLERFAKQISIPMPVKKAAFGLF